MDINLVIAENVKRLRKARKISIDRMAELAGVSRSMLGQIERGEANPSAALLQKLSLTLKVPVKELLHEEERPDTTLFRALDAPGQREDGGKVVFHTSFPYDGNARMEQRRLDVYISGALDLAPESPGCVAYLLLLVGSLDVTVEGELFRMEQWDGLRFFADRPCRLENQTTATARAVITYRYPQ